MFSSMIIMHQPLQVLKRDITAAEGMAEMRKTLL